MHDVLQGMFENETMVTQRHRSETASAENVTNAVDSLRLASSFRWILLKTKIDRTLPTIPMTANIVRIVKDSQMISGCGLSSQYSTQGTPDWLELLLWLLWTLFWFPW